MKTLDLNTAPGLTEQDPVPYLLKVPPELGIPGQGGRMLLFITVKNTRILINDF